MPTGSEQRWRLLSEVFNPELQLMLLPPQLLLCIDVTTILLGPTCERKTQGMRLAGWLAMMMKLLLSSTNPFLPSVVQQQLKKQYTKEATKKESNHLRNQQQLMWVPQSKGVSEEGKACTFV
jgi:hypothetical protein